MNFKRQSGFAHLALLLLVLVLAVAAFAGYKVYSNRQTTTQANLTSTSLTNVTVIKSAGDLNTAVKTMDSQNIDSDLNPDGLNSDISNLL